MLTRRPVKPPAEFVDAYSLVLIDCRPGTYSVVYRLKQQSQDEEDRTQVLECRVIGGDWRGGGSSGGISCYAICLGILPLSRAGPAVAATAAAAVAASAGVHRRHRCPTSSLLQIVLPSTDRPTDRRTTSSAAASAVATLQGAAGV